MTHTHFVATYTNRDEEISCDVRYRRGTDDGMGPLRIDVDLMGNEHEVPVSAVDRAILCKSPLGGVAVCTLTGVRAL